MPQQTGPSKTLPVTYDPELSVLTIASEGGGSKTFVNWNSIEATPIDDEQYTTEKATTGERAWIRSPEWGSEVTIEFSGGLSNSQRNWIRQRIGEKVDITVKDKSGTADGIFVEDARMVQQPDYSRDDSEPTFEVVFQSPFASWTSNVDSVGEETYALAD